MNLTVISDERLARTPDGAAWTSAGSSYATWRRYLDTFDSVNVVARVRAAAAAPAGSLRADGAGVYFHDVPYYRGPARYLLRYQGIRRAIRMAILRTEAVLLRVPGTLASIAFGYLAGARHPFAVQVIGDPYDSFAPGSVAHPLRPFFRWSFARALRRHCANACAASYVTASYLQARYPCPHFTANISDVVLDSGALAPFPRMWTDTARAFTLITVGTLDQLYKAPDVLIDAVGVCVREGLDLRLVLVGDGRYRPALTERAAAQGLRERVCFAGMVASGAPVFGELDRADLFVLPSKTDALPKALLEAMARALPCIGSTVGGIPDLLAPEDLVVPGNVAALARKIREVVTTPARMARMSARNLEIARAYREEILQPRRAMFDAYLCKRTEAWLNAQR